MKCPALLSKIIIPAAGVNGNEPVPVNEPTCNVGILPTPLLVNVKFVNVPEALGTETAKPAGTATELVVNDVPS